MSRLTDHFEALRADGRKALVSFIMAGDPDAGTTVALLHELARSADILELGVPFMDPMADGPVIQAAGLRAIQNGMTLTGVFQIVQEFRSKNFHTPLVLMGYFNPILRYGHERFFSKCNEIGVDGVIIVDMPPEQAHEISTEAQQFGIDLVRLAAPTSSAGRLGDIAASASGFIYYVSITGVTGTAASNPRAVAENISAIKKLTDTPVVVGFGIRTPDDARAMAAVADGVVVGSALVETIARLGTSPDLVAEIGRQAAALAKAVRD